MSHQKEFQCQDSTKIRLEVTLQSGETFSDHLEENSKELEEYISELVATNKRNPKYLCMACWCHLTYPQKHYHLPNHSAYIKMAGQYSEKESFTKLTIEYGHFAEKNLIKYLFKIKEKPPICIKPKRKRK